jgi:predicted MFS family arabinose efflux permease
MVLCGAFLPIVALAIGWRWAFALSALAPFVAIVVVLATIPHQPRPGADGQMTAPNRPLGSDVLWLAGYALFVGLAGGSVMTYLPLYSQEVLGMSGSSAGLVVAIMGIVSAVGRVAWGHFARNSSDLRSRLRTIAVLAVGAALLFWSASFLSPHLVWIGAVAWGASLLSVGAIGNLAVMVYSAVENTGRASGVMLTGFGVGLMIGPPVFGATVDTTGAYDVGFGLVVVELVALTMLSFAWGRRTRVSAPTAA